MTASWPIGGLPEGTDYQVWLRAAGMSGTTVRELLQDTLPVQAAAYQRAEEALVDELATVPPVPSAPSPAVAGVSTDRARWDVHLRAESTITTALRHLQDNEVSECMVLLVQAASQVFEVVLLDRNEQKAEG
ncbi:hypothetical protein [Arthrobacter sp. SDTb3-6]|uniref:hypothetical protein n=1 Tax=Arthrobacter sp. SDTb3-6 TaxID=2713571 RepID=UPI00159D4FA1|nr:hypothetical protein [Arthrobacter sp. SDTb3-6]NVM97805.1 hypothetical protein [Arthrobacter sp. SDTb3-6]